MKIRFIFSILLASIILLSGYLLTFCRAEEEVDTTPEWMKRINFSAEWETHRHPIFYFETVQPIYQSEDKIDTFFYQPRVSIKAEEFTYNLGAGYRRLLSEDLLWGINAFGDYENSDEHGRAGAGVELLGQTLEGRLNTYFGITSKRIVEEQANVCAIYEKIANGFDFELGAPVPYLPWLKLYASGFWYDFKKTDDRTGWKSRLEAKLTEALVLEFYTWDDDKGAPEYGGKAECRLAFDSLSDFKEIFKLADEAFPRKDLKKSTLIPVERNFDIVVEKWSEAGNVVIEIRRGN